MAVTDEELIAEIAPFTKSSPQRIAAMASALGQIDREHIVGDIVECGVWRGGNIILARRLSPSRTCWLFDTFTGMTEPEDIDVSASGRKAIDSYNGRKKPGGKWSGVSLDEVRANIGVPKGVNDSHLRFVAGAVESTLLDPANIPAKIALLRLDTDWHASTKVELEVLYPRLQPSGILIVDDYGHWMGARKAVDEYFGTSGSRFQKIDYTAVMMVKQ